ncbi:ABC transporter ATP-binding protein [Phycisphaerales bacterium AB-hyl4]|uniref:ABC transporter ATP-binding protein n=1 Tax=Natronomicrosphaera hydrolytica TaxID=3242702 RepID=A0ABV4U4N2_9BACT
MSANDAKASHSNTAKTLTHRELDARDEPNQRPLSMAIILRLLSFTRPYAWQRNTLIGIVLLRAVQVPLLAWAVAAIINSLIARRDWDGLLWGTAGFVALAVFAEVTMHFRQRYALELGEKVIHDLRQLMFEHLQRMPMRFFNITKLGRVISRFVSDAEALRSGVQDVLFVSLVGGGRMVVAAAIMLWYDPVLFGVVAAMAPVLHMINRYFRSKLSLAYRQVQESMSRVTATLAESVSGIRVTQGFVRQDVNAELFNDLIEDHSEYNMRAAKLTGVFLPLIELNSQFFISVLLLLAGYQVVNNVLWVHEDPVSQVEALVVFFFMVPQFFGPLSALARQYNQALTAMAGAERVFSLLDHEPEPLDPPDAVDVDEIEGRVEFDEVGFEYQPGKPVLHDINFTAEPGQTIALVGHTGSGKSTIINLISKFYLPTAGQIRIDDLDLVKISADSMAKQLGIVLQQNFLFTGTVMDNIRVGKPDATEEDVYEAAAKLDCLDLFEAMPEGFNTNVGERGGNLSLGQRQLVCFTRAMLADPRIMILDEATSSVDTMTEARIQKALSLLLTNRTSFVVAHRLSTIRHADMVLVLDGGRIIERGTHNELLATAGVYANLYRQFIHASEA